MGFNSGFKGLIEHNVCVLVSVQPSYKRFLTVRRIERDAIINARGSSRGYFLFLSDFNEA
jgi:hypothetical protein